MNRILPKKFAPLERIFSRKSKSVAHFLLIPELLYSPPNDAIIRAYSRKGYHIDVFSPNVTETQTLYGDHVRVLSVSYTWIWIIKNILSLRWLDYEIISGTSEDPLVVVGLLRFLYRKKSVALVDEIKSGSYRGDRSEYWKKLCRWSIRKADFSIVNDVHRIELLREYARLSSTKEVVVYPGCFVETPSIDEDIESTKNGWGLPRDAFVIGSSGGFNLTAGADWLLDSIQEINDIYAVIQPLGVSELSLLLMERLPYSDRIYVQKNRLSWNEAWKQARGFDIGLSIYSNPAPQFQHMGISSNRLCMFIAMGVPVIASRQKSFSFLEKYNCGVLVSNLSEFIDAIHTIRNSHVQMKENCQVCLEEYIRPAEKFKHLFSMINHLGSR
jgi:hypothetical protein